MGLFFYLRAIFYGLKLTASGGISLVVISAVKTFLKLKVMTFILIIHHAIFLHFIPIKKTLGGRYEREDSYC